jgi:glycosidase
MKKQLLLAFLLVIQSILFSQDIKIEKAQPPYWWVGMENQKLQLMLYGNEISLSSPEINYPGVELKETIRVENPNYLFLDLEISKEAKPGIMNIVIRIGNRLIPPFQYELKECIADSTVHQGFDQSDVVYLLMPDRFSNGDTMNDSQADMLEKADRDNPNGRHGGDIAGIKNHLGYIQDFGATVIWINPLVENNNPEYSYHGYAITDFYKIDPRFGSNNDYFDLVKSAHENDLKVIMDMVFNHASVFNWLILDLPESNWIHQFPDYTQSNFRASTITDPYASEYDRARMLEGWFDKHMADLDQRSELLTNFLIQNSIWWIEASGIDGIRIDTQPYSYKEFLTEWSERVFREYPDFNVVGETWLQKESITAYFQKDAPNTDGYNSGIPCVTDFPLRGAINSAFNEKDGWTEGLAKLYYVLAQDFLYDKPENTFVFADNHDLTRYYTAMGEDFNKWKMGMAFLMTTRGIPMIYYGTEILMTGYEHEGHGFIRKDFPGGWPGDENNAFQSDGRSNEQNEAYDYLQKLFLLRKNNPVVYEGKLKQFVPENEVYVYFRYDDDECVMVILNNSNNQIKALNTERFKECMEGYNYAINIETGENINYLDVLTLSPKSVTILELKK